MDYQKLASEQGVLVDYVKYANSDVLDKLLVAKSPVSLMHEGVEYRIIPMYNEIAISETGVVISIITNNRIKMFRKLSVMTRYSGSLYVQTHDSLNKQMRTPSIITLIALAWVDNDNYAKYSCAVNTEPGTPPTSDNVKWMTRGVARSYIDNYNNLDCVTINVDTDEVLLHSSVADAAKYLKLRTNTLYNKKMPGVIENKQGSFIVDTSGDIDNIDDIGALYRKLRAKYYVVKPTYGPNTEPTEKDVETAEYFRTISEIINNYELKCQSVIFEVSDALSILGLKVVDMRRGLSGDTYDIKNITTGVEHTNISRDKACSIMKTTPGLIRSRITRVNPGLPINNWIIKSTEDADYPGINKKIFTNTYVLEHEDGNILRLTCLKTVAKHLSCKVNELLRILNRDKRIAGYKVYIEL